MGQSSTSLAPARGGLALALALCLAASQSLQADEHGDGEPVGRQLEEVVVSAERQEQSLLEVPISVTSFDSDVIEKYQITNLKDLEVRVPGLQFGLDSPATIRGIGSLYRGVGGDVAVAQYSNDLYFDEPYGVLSSMYDLERVEVLRGPQGTLYGRNAIAGAINYVNKRPSHAGFGAGVQTEVSTYNGYRLNGHLNMVLSDMLAFRVTGEAQSSDGVQENISGPDQGGRDDFNIAPQLNLKTDRLEVNLRYAHFQQDSASELRVPVRYPDITQEFHENPLDGSPSEERNQFYGYSHYQPPSIRDGDLSNVIDMNNGGTTDVDRDAIGLHVDYTLNDSLTASYILGVSDVAIGLLDQDCDGSSVTGSTEDPFLSASAGVPYADCTIRARFDVGINTHEFQLRSDGERTSTLAGVYVFDQDVYNEYKLYDVASRAAGVSSADAIPLEFIFGAPVFYPEEGVENVFIGEHVADGSYQFLDLWTDRVVESLAGYAHINYQVNEQWSATAGLRYTEDQKEVLNDRLWVVIDFEEEDPTDDFVIPARFNEQNVVDGNGEREQFSKMTWNVSLDYTPAVNRLVYGRIATGYRSGGITPGVPDPYQTYEDEDLISYELGYKADLYDNRLRVLLSGFVYNFSNYQQPIRIRRFQPSIQDIGVIANLPDTFLGGIEFEGKMLLTQYFAVSGYYAYQTSSMGSLLSSDPVNPRQQFEEFTFVDPATGLTRTTYLGEQFDLEGNELPNMPNHKWSLTGEGQFNLEENGLVTYALTYSYTGERFNRIFNIPNDRLANYGRFDATATWHSVNGKHRVSGYIENIFDTIGMMELESNGWSSGYYQDATLTDPRLMGLVYQWTY